MTFIHGRALVIGVANYQRVKKLPEKILNDARDIASILSDPDACAFDPRCVEMVLDSAATLAGIRKALSDLSQACGPDDTALVYFSGHGGVLGDGASAETYLVPVDGDLKSHQNSMLSEGEFSAVLKTLQAKRIFVILDACHAAGAIVLKSLDDADSGSEFYAGYAEKSLSQLSGGAGRVVLASCAPAETSLILAGAKNSLFTTHLLDALRGKGEPSGSQVVRVFNLFDYISTRVRADSRNKQTPIFKADLSENFAIAMLGGSSAKTPISVVEDRGDGLFDWEGLLAVLQSLYPLGPTDQHIWKRAGGDLARISVGGAGSSDWYGALEEVRNGGGGAAISLRRLADTAAKDYPTNQRLRQLIG